MAVDRREEHLFVDGGEGGEGGGRVRFGAWFKRGCGRMGREGSGGVEVEVEQDAPAAVFEEGLQAGLSVGGTLRVEAVEVDLLGQVACRPPECCEPALPVCGVRGGVRVNNHSRKRGSSASPRNTGNRGPPAGRWRSRGRRPRTRGRGPGTRR
ncbi:MAG: hypothetical protein M5U12_27285 [Verrucomicrobia bacterium]|nr:hypothetical protein [Verrucomicrobiota bacterium]